MKGVQKPQYHASAAGACSKNYGAPRETAEHRRILPKPYTKTFQGDTAGSSKMQKMHHERTATVYRCSYYVCRLIEFQRVRFGCRPVRCCCVCSHRLPSEGRVWLSSCCRSGQPRVGGSLRGRSGSLSALSSPPVGYGAYIDINMHQKHCVRPSANRQLKLLFLWRQQYVKKTIANITIKRRRYLRLVSKCTFSQELQKFCFLFFKNKTTKV